MIASRAALFVILGLGGTACAGAPRGGAAPVLGAGSRPAIASETATAAPAPAATVVRPGELPAAVIARRDSLIARGRGLQAEAVGYYMDVQEARFRQVASTWLRVSRKETKVALSLPGALSFTVGSTSLSPRAVTALDSVAQVLVEYRHTVVSLHGHTDSIGDTGMNQRLSEQRALAVAKVLIAGGVAAERILVAGYGSTNPVAPNGTEEGRDANRRVEIEVSPLRPAAIRETGSIGHR